MQDWPTIERDAYGNILTVIPPVNVVYGGDGSYIIVQTIEIIHPPVE